MPCRYQERVSSPDNLVLSQQLQKYYGQITPEVAIANITAIEQSGDSHIAYYDLTTLDLWVAFEVSSSLIAGAHWCCRPSCWIRPAVYSL